MAVAVPSKWVCIYATVLVVMFIGATATVRNHGISRIKSLPALSRFQPVFTASSASFPGKKAEAAVIPERAGDKKTSGPNPCTTLPVRDPRRCFKD